MRKYMNDPDKDRQVRRLDEDCHRLGVVIRNELIRLMVEWGYTDEEIDERLAGTG